VDNKEPLFGVLSGTGLYGFFIFCRLLTPLNCYEIAKNLGEQRRSRAPPLA
jgi:hypothetical protein